MNRLSFITSSFNLLLEKTTITFPSEENTFILCIKSNDELELFNLPDFSLIYEKDDWIFIFNNIKTQRELVLYSEDECQVIKFYEAEISAREIQWTNLINI